MLAIAVILVPLQAKSGSPYDGVSGGVLRGLLSNEAQGIIACEIVVPDSVIVLDAKFAGERAIVTVADLCAIDYGSRQLPRFEVWMFKPRSERQTLVTMADRKVIASKKPASGEQPLSFQYSLNCEVATAVYSGDDLYHGSVLLFDSDGKPVRLDVGDIAAACGCAFTHVRPISWIGVGGTLKLALAIGGDSGPPHYALFDWDTRKVAALTQEEFSGELQWNILLLFSMLHRR
ncbi:MAG: hypothetical protein IPH86_12795 [bacterium]|nr:hypothetical protein [bacterium]